MIHLGDITKSDGHNVPITDCVVGGSPCQDLSVAGKRAGLDGERSGLFMEQIRIVKEMRERDRLSRFNGRTNESIRPRYMVWENVPGAFSSNKGEDFRVVLEEVARISEEGVTIPRPEKGKWSNSGVILGDNYSIAWRVFDAQYWGVPQRRRRICLVADFNGHSAAEIVFNEDKQYGCSIGRNSDSSVRDIGAESRPEVQPFSEGLSGDTEQSGEERKAIASDAEGSIGTGHPAFTYQDREWKPGGGKGGLIQEDKATSLRTNNYMTVFQPVVYDARGNGDGNIVPTMTGDHQNRITDYTGVVVQKAFRKLAAGTHASTPHLTKTIIKVGCKYIVRRLTPLECERLQGYPDGWTDIVDYIDSKGKKRKVADSNRYKALGNSIALPSWKWIIKRISARYERDATLASLFDGIGGFPYLWEQINGKGSCLWASEIEDFPIAVTKERFR